jgi:hypothetical protein
MFATLAASTNFVEGLRHVEALAVQAKKSKAGHSQKMKKILDLLKGLQTGMITSQSRAAREQSRSDTADPLLNILAGKAPVP